MNEHHDPLDPLVLRALDADGRNVDKESMVDRVRAARIAAGFKSVRRRQWIFGSLVATAASLLIVFFFVMPPRTEQHNQLSAEEVIRQAKTQHEANGQDRCYVVESDWDVKPSHPRLRWLPIARTALIWTRGDQFVLQSAVGEQSWAWGQDKASQVWLAPSRKQAIIFDATELNEPLARSCELMSLRIVSTLGELLEKFQLSRSDASGDIVIDALLKPGFFNGMSIRKLKLKLDRDSKCVKYAELHRYFNNEPIGQIRFTLVETREQTESFYSVTSHTEVNATILDGKPLPNPPLLNRSRFRDELLKRLQDRNK